MKNTYLNRFWNRFRKIFELNEPAKLVIIEVE